MRRKKLAFIVALALVACAAIFFLVTRPPARRLPDGFVTTRDGRFMVDGKPFRFVGANVAVVYGDEERGHMPETLRAIAGDGVGVVRVWAFGEVDARDGYTRSVAKSDWMLASPFRRSPDEWNEDAFIHLDRIIAEAARNNLRVQLCLVNWWPDTGGVTQYLRWAGVPDAYDTNYPHGVNVERAVQFYTNAEARRLYRQHVERVVTRRNTVTGKLYREDPTIFGYELMNEAQSPSGRYVERRAWLEEMSAYVKSLDPDHLLTAGTWGYRFSWERREWLLDHSLPHIDYCDVHHYPRDDLDSYVLNFDDLQRFIDNRAAAAHAVGKPLVFGEFGIPHEGFNGHSQPLWFRAYLESAARSGVAGAMFWIWTHARDREYGLTYTTTRDDGVRAELKRGAELFASLAGETPPPRARNNGQHLVPHQFVFARPDDDAAARPVARTLDDKTLLYRFMPEQAARGRFEKMGGGSGYVWGMGVGFFEYVVPAREEWQRVSEVVVRAHLQPTPPWDSQGRIDTARVTLFINDRNCGTRLVSLVKPPQAIVQEWRVDSLLVRADAARGKSLAVRFSIEPDADLPHGLNISNFPYDAKGATPVEVEVR